MRRASYSLLAVVLTGLGLVAVAPDVEAAPPPKFVAHNVLATDSYSENNVTSFYIAVWRGGLLRCASTVNYAFTDVTTSIGYDYNAPAMSGTLSWAKNEFTKYLLISVVNDGAPESSETFTLTISNPTTSCKGGVQPSIGNSVLTVTITDTDIAFVLDPGESIFLTSMSLTGCNSLEAELDVTGSPVALGNNSSSLCTSTPLSDFEWANTGTGPITVRPSVDDTDCGLIYYSDTTSYHYSWSTYRTENNHAAVSAFTGGWDVDIADAGGACALWNAIEVPTTDNGNFSADVVIGPSST